MQSNAVKVTTKAYVKRPRLRPRTYYTQYRMRDYDRRKAHYGERCAVTSQVTLQEEAGGLIGARPSRTVTQPCHIDGLSTGRRWSTAKELQAPNRVAQAAMSCCLAGQIGQGALQRKPSLPINASSGATESSQLIVQQVLAAFFSTGCTASTWF